MGFFGTKTNKNQLLRIKLLPKLIFLIFFMNRKIFDSADIGCVFNSYWQILLNKSAKKSILCGNY